MGFQTFYKPLQQIPDSQVQNGNDEDHHYVVESTSSSKTSCLLILIIAALAVSNGVLIWREMHQDYHNQDPPYWGSQKAVMKPYHWTSAFSSENKTETTPLWKALFPVGDGLVTLQDDWAALQHLPPSLKRYENTTESIYFVAAYHQLHCLAIIRSVIYHLKEGVELTVPFGHATHCLDSLRQSTMCHADDTLLYTLDAHSYGDGQPRVCKDWDALERWTREHRIYVEGA